MAINYFYRVLLADPGVQGNPQIGFDSTFLVAGSPTAQDHDVRTEEEGRKQLLRISRFKGFAAVVDNSATKHTIHTLLLLEQNKTAAATVIEFYKWDDKVKQDKQGNASLIKLAKDVLNSKVTGHTVTGDGDAYWFRFDLEGGAEFEDSP